MSDHGPYSDLGCIYGSVQSVGTRAVNFSDEPTERFGARIAYGTTIATRSTSSIPRFVLFPCTSECTGFAVELPDLAVFRFHCTTSGKCNPDCRDRST